MATATKGQRRRLVRRRTRGASWGWLALSAILVVLGGILVFGLRASQPQGTLAAERTAHDFGQAAITGGLLTTRFPIAVQGDALVTDLGTT